MLSRGEVQVGGTTVTLTAQAITATGIYIRHMFESVDMFNHTLHPTDQSDYQLLSSGISVPLGTNTTTPVCVAVPVFINDDVLESLENLTLTLSGDVVDPAAAIATINIRDDECK